MSGQHETREAAAQELFDKFPKLTAVETANAVPGGDGIGGNAQSIKRPGASPHRWL